MREYILDVKNGTLRENGQQKEEQRKESQQNEAVQEKAQQKEGQQEDACRVLLATLEEFEADERTHPRGNDLLHSLNCEKYCKAEFSHHCIQGIIRTPSAEGHKQKPFLFGFLLYRNTLWLVSDDAELEERMENIQEDLFEGFSIQDVLLAFLNHLISEDMVFLQKVEEGLERLEEHAVKRKQGHFNETIMKNRRKLSQRHSYYVQLMNIGDYMQSVLRGQSSDAENGWNLFTHRVERLHDYVEMLREYLLQIREMHQTQMDMEQNRIVTLLTVITTIFLPLTLVTGWYGMNFTQMPELNWQYGYRAVIILSVLVVAAEVCYFKKKKML